MAVNQVYISNKKKIPGYFNKKFSTQKAKLWSQRVKLKGGKLLRFFEIWKNSLKYENKGRTVIKIGFGYFSFKWNAHLYTLDRTSTVEEK